LPVWKPKTNVAVAGFGTTRRNAGIAPPGSGRRHALRLLGYESMKSREAVIRLKRFQLDEKRRKVAQIEGMIAEFDRMAADLDREILAEQERAGIHDPSHFAYPTYAKAAIGRRNNLKRSADDLKNQLNEAKATLGEAFEELKKVEWLDERDQMRERAVENACEETRLDDVGGMRARDALGI
jgi:flagellar FliJ protein